MAGHKMLSSNITWAVGGRLLGPRLLADLYKYCTAHLPQVPLCYLYAAKLVLPIHAAHRTFLFIYQLTLPYNYTIRNNGILFFELLIIKTFDTLDFLDSLTKWGLYLR